MNTFTMEAGAKFDGLLVAGSGLRNPKQIVFDPSAIQQLVGLEFPTVLIKNTLAYEAPDISDLNGKTAKALASYVNLGGIPGVSVSAPGLNTRSLNNMDNVTVGPGFQVVVGSNYNIGVGWNGAPTFDASRVRTGANEFTIEGTNLFPIPGENLLSRTLQAARDAVGITQALGVHLFTGLAGSDIYKFNATLWGVAAIAELPDIKVGGITLPGILRYPGLLRVEPGHRRLHRRDHDGKRRRTHQRLREHRRPDRRLHQGSARPGYRDQLHHRHGRDLPAARQQSPVEYIAEQLPAFLLGHIVARIGAEHRCARQPGCGQ